MGSKLCLAAHLLAFTLGKNRENECLAGVRVQNRQTALSSSESLQKRISATGFHVFDMCLSCFRENLEKLLEDRHFKEEIVHFNICEEKGVVEASHRARLIPILMRCGAFDHPLAQIAEKSQLLEH